MVHKLLLALSHARELQTFRLCLSIRKRVTPLLQLLAKPLLYTKLGMVSIYFTPEDKQLIDLFQRYAENLEAITLKSELEQLKDKSSPEEVRKTAKQKVLGFLYKVAPAIGQSALNVLTVYLQKVLTGT